MSRGGARSGAGRPAQNVLIDNMCRLDVRELHRRGRLYAGSSFVWSWLRGGEHVGSVGIRVTLDEVILAYRLGDGAEPKRKTLYLSRTPCQYGGSRTWFHCPWCAHRVAVVYMAGSDWGCRHCLRVRYRSQSEDPLQRTWRRTNKIEAKLAVGKHRPLGKPAGMRWATFDRLLDELADIQERRNVVFCASVARAFPHLSRR